MQVTAEKLISTMLAADAMGAARKKNYIKFDFIYYFLIFTSVIV